MAIGRNFLEAVLTFIVTNLRSRNFQLQPSDRSHGRLDAVQKKGSLPMIHGIRQTLNDHDMIVACKGGLPHSFALSAEE